MITGRHIYLSLVCYVSIQKGALLPLSDELTLCPSEHDVDMAMQALQLLEIQDHVQEVLQLNTGLGQYWIIVHWISTCHCSTDKTLCV